MITYIIIKCIANPELKYRIYKARPQRAHAALEDLTALPQRPHSALSNTLCKCHVALLKTNAAALRFRRLHIVFTAFPQRCWRRYNLF